MCGACGAPRGSTCSSLPQTVQLEGTLLASHHAVDHDVEVLESATDTHDIEALTSTTHIPDSSVLSHVHNTQNIEAGTDAQFQTLAAIPSASTVRDPAGDRGGQKVFLLSRPVGMTPLLPEDTVATNCTVTIRPPHDNYYCLQPISDIYFDSNAAPGATKVPRILAHLVHERVVVEAATKLSVTGVRYVASHLVTECSDIGKADA